MEVNRESEDSINLIEMNDTVFVWTSQDWWRLRKLRIVGTLVGNMATLSKQDQIAALPMSLLREEVTLLLEKGYAKLKTIPHLAECPDEEIRMKCKKHREALLSEQVELLKTERKKEIEAKIDIIMEGKRAKKRKMSDGDMHSEEPNVDEILKEEINKIESSQETALSIQICTNDPWIKEEDMVDRNWKHSGRRDVNYLVFKDLWEKGYYLTLGGKFGGDYLAYPGDPVKFHAFFIVICLDKNKKLQMQDIITYGRLGQSVRKTVVLSYINDTNEVTYQSIRWAGF